jgi:hypothetical protein
MAREYGRIMSAIWRNPDYRLLEIEQQWAYEMLVSQADISSAGVLAMTITRWTTYATDSHLEGLSKALAELDTRRFVVCDEITQELLVRKFIWYDQGYNNPKRQKAIIAAAHTVVSPRLRASLAIEMALVGLAHDLSDSPSDSPSIAHQEGLSGSPSDTPPDGLSDTPRFPVPVSVTEPGALNRNLEPTTAPTSSPRKSDEIWDALLLACKINSPDITPAMRGSLNRCVSDLRDVGATADEVAVRARRYTLAMPDARLTPPALAKHWAALSQPPPPPAPGKIRNGW